MRDDLVAVLARDYGEKLAGQGVTADGQLAELFLAENGGFTFIVTTPSGISCILSAGDDWDGVNSSATTSPNFPRRMH